MTSIGLVVLHIGDVTTYMSKVILVARIKYQNIHNSERGRKEEKIVGILIHFDTVVVHF